MTYVHRFRDTPHPHLAFGPTRAWEGLSAVRVRASPGRHPGAASGEHRLLFYLTSDVRADCACEGVGGGRVLAAADFDLVPAGASGVWEDHGPVDFISVRLAPAVVAEAAEALGVPEARADLAPRLGARDPLVSRLVFALAAEVEAPEGASRLYADSLALALATRLLQEAPEARGGRQTLSKPQLRRIVEHVEANLEGELTLAGIAAVAGLSVPHLTSLFRRTMGQSVHAYVMERRVCRARDLLLAGRTSIAEVAIESGFAHQSHLARWTRRLLGVTPGELLRS
ncbi:transcriptional regulator, AraC family [Phenylobacterium zucineum HLK1]|uniref:Transcriptional regulator, AraC family n=1 Tax=Phenylobacterium zucineum (strain HLK1) TaxID=450851 RepID=B4R8Y5_PHEZH|nr:AraC family transcriptional regulator [Phenylobacterium zucineum]ACG79350.1 transcriptional regulator, AraC family [Phenylobacterium zucineum HLK1]